MEWRSARATRPRSRRRRALVSRAVSWGPSRSGRAARSAGPRLVPRTARRAGAACCGVFCAAAAAFSAAVTCGAAVACSAAVRRVAARRAAMQSMWAGLAAEQFRAAGGEESLVDGAIVCSNATNLLQASCTPSKPQKLQIACSQLAACKTLARTRNPMHASPQASERVLCACARPCAHPKAS